MPGASESSLFDQDWLTKAKLIRCSAPLPEGLDNPVLEKMLQVAPCPEPLKEDTGEDNTGGRRPPTLPILTEGVSDSMKEDDRRRKIPEGLDNPVLEKMLQVTPCPEPLKEDTGKDIRVDAGPQRCPL